MGSAIYQVRLQGCPPKTQRALPLDLIPLPSCGSLLSTALSTLCYQLEAVHLEDLLGL